MVKICKFLLQSIEFVSNRIVPCSSRIWEEDGAVEKYFIKADENTSPEILTSYITLRNKYIDICKRGKIPEFCKNCNLYEPIEIDKNLINKIPFKRLSFKERLVCNCRCIYCCLTGDSEDINLFEKINKEKYYDIKPFIEYVNNSQENMVNEETLIEIAGGECTLYPDELEYIIDFGLKHNCKFQILTNGIIYNKSIEKALNTNKASLICSIDCGTKETFEKIKRVKMFEKVKENITKYAQAGNKIFYDNVMLKYILCPNINDNIEEAKQFYKLARECSIKKVILSIDRFWLSENADKPISEQIKNFVKYFIFQKDYPEIYNEIDFSFVYKWWFDRIFEKPDTKLSNNIFDRIRRIFNK